MITVGNSQTGSEALLGVECSLSGRRWVGLSDDQDRLAMMITQRCRLPDQLARTLARRNLTPAEARPYLSPRLRNLMVDPSRIKDMDKAADRLQYAVGNSERLAVFVRSSVDGSCAWALLRNWFARVGAKVAFRTSRTANSCGEPSLEDIQAAADTHGLIICVDCGTLANHDFSTPAGTDVMIVDDSVSTEFLPDVLAILNANRFDEEQEPNSICSTGMAFMLLVAANRLRRRIGHSAPSLLGSLDLLALATQAERTRLVGVNRAFVARGLDLVKRRRRPGLRALADAIPLMMPPNAHTLSSEFAPRILAGGALGSERLGAQLLAETNIAKAKVLAAELNDIYDEMLPKFQTMAHEAVALASEKPERSALFWAASQNWPSSALAYITEFMSSVSGRASIAMSTDGTTALASGLSIPGVDIGVAIANCIGEGFVSKGGGNAMKVEFEMPVSNVVNAMAYIDRQLRKQGAIRIAAGTELRLDGLMRPKALTVDTVESLELAGPFGLGSPRPRFAFPFQRIKYRRKIGESHLHLRFADGAENQAEAFCPAVVGTDLGRFLMSCRDSQLHLAGSPTIWIGRGKRRASLRIEDVAKAD